MKQLFLILATATVLASCNNSTSNTEVTKTDSTTEHSGNSKKSACKVRVNDPVEADGGLAESESEK
jgi:ABC-type uncharacterized transport system auxiliary subunit